MDWLNVVKSTQAKTKINQWFKHQLKGENVERVKFALDAYCKAKQIDLNSLIRLSLVEKVLKKYNFRDWDAVVAAIGHGGLKEGQVVNRLLELDKQEKLAQGIGISNEEVLAELGDKRKELTASDIPSGGIKVHGLHDVAVRFARCCNPVPGDEICGFITRGRGITVHRTDCDNVLAMDEADRGRLIEAEWVSQEGDLANAFITSINIYGPDRPGLMYDVSSVFKEANISFLGIGSKVSKNGMSTIDLQFKVHSKEELRSLTEKAPD